MTDTNLHLARFLREVKSRFDPRSPETFWTCEPPFQQLLASPFLAEVVNTQLHNLAKTAHHSINWIASEFVLHRGGGFALSASVFEHPQRYIHSLPYHAMYASAGPAGLVCASYRLPDNYRNEVFDPSLKLAGAETLTAMPGHVMLLRSGTQAYDFVVEMPTLVVKFMTSAIQPLEWLFTRSGLQAWQANDTDLSFTQLRVATDVLGKFAHQTSLSPLKRLTRHRHHAVRWAAIQNVGRLSRSEAIIELRQAINDPHPHVQRAAQKTLEKLNAK